MSVAPSRAHASTELPAWARGRAALVALALLGAAMQLESLSFGLFGDDYFHMVAVASRLLGAELPGHWWDIFGVPSAHRVSHETAIAIGTAPWWVSDEFSLAFFRPLTAALHFLDYALWPASPALMHAHNLAWYALLIALVALCYRRLAGPGLAPLLGAVFYAVDEAHAEGAAWIAGRNTIVSASFCAAALLLHIKAAPRSSLRGSWGVALFVGLALLAGEGGVAVWGLLLAYALVLDTRPLGARVRSLAPALLVSAVWAATHRLLGYGVHGSGVYLDPLGSPSALLDALPRRFALVWLELFTVPASFYDLLPASAVRPVRIAALVLALSLTGLFVVRARRDRHIAFWLVAAVLCTLPFCSALSPARLMFTPSIASFALLASVAAPALERAWWSRRPALGLRALAIASLILHGAFAAAFCPVKIHQLKGLDNELRSLAGSLPLPPAASDKTVFVLNTPVHLATSTTLYLRDPALGPIAGFFGVGANREPVVLTRLSRSVLELVPQGGYMREITSLLVRRGSEPFQLGARFRVGPGVLRVTQLTPDGRPARIQLELANLDDPRWVWVHWQGESSPYRLVQLPPIGASLILTPFPMRPRAEESVWL